MFTYTLSRSARHPGGRQLLVVCVLLVGFPAVARSVNTITSQAITSGGGATTSASHTIRATLGETMVGQAVSASYTINAGLWPIITPFPCPSGCIAAFGLPHTTLGQAQLELDMDGDLVIDNIGSSGEDGVAVGVGEAQFLRVEFADLGSAPDGATVHLAGDGTVDGLMGQPVSSLTMSRAGDDWIITPDFSAIGSPSFQYQVFSDGEAVGAIPGGEGASLIASAAPGTIGSGGDAPPPIISGDCGCGVGVPVRWKCDSEGDPHDGDRWVFSCEGQAFSFPFECPDEFGSPWGGWGFDSCAPSWGWWWDTAEATTFARADGTGDVLIGDTVQIVILEDPDVSFPLSQVSITAADMPSFIIGEEQLGMFSLPHRALGVATFGPEGASLSVHNIGSSGQDGVGIHVGEALSVSISFPNLDSTGWEREGAFIDSSATGSVGGIPDQVLGSSRVTNIGPELAITADFSPIGSSTLLVQVYNDGMPVTEETCDGGRTPCNLKVSEYPGSSEQEVRGGASEDFEIEHIWFWAEPISIEIAGGPPVIGDELRIIPQDAEVVDFISAVTIRAADIPSITITGGMAIPVVAEGDGDCDDDGDVDLADFACFQACFGQSVLYHPECRDADLDRNGDVDAEDFASFADCLAGPDQPPACGP